LKKNRAHDSQDIPVNGTNQLARSAAAYYNVEGGTEDDSKLWDALAQKLGVDRNIIQSAVNEKLKVSILIPILCHELIMRLERAESKLKERPEGSELG
jgi:hypothetical protein